MGVSWTKEQQQVIDLRNRNILVSAAAGSGKTAVLVERIRKMITDQKHPVDIDRLLIVTFTNAAAAEMRERIGAAIEAALEEDTGNEHLLRQLTLIHNAQITTIDSFCLYVIRNHFHEIDLEPNFRIGDEGELKLLRGEVLKKVLKSHYEAPDETFTAFVEGYAPGRSDAALGEMITRLYEFSMSYPWPAQWLDGCVKDYNITNIDELDRCMWIQTLTENIRYAAEDLIKLTEEAFALTQDVDGPGMYEKAVQSDLTMYRDIAGLQTFTEFFKAFSGLKYERLASAKGYTGNIEKQERVKELRETAKDTVKKLNRQYFFCPPEVMIKRLSETEPMARELVNLTKEFAEAFAAEKRRKNLIDFHDMEHFALEILVDEASGQAKKTAEEFRDNFEEIMIDEYQDSNHVQETILRAISREARGEYNIFMVGDVKQSIYRFRLARPELFMEKYDTYTAEESEKQRIVLHKNFRSRKEVLSCANDIFFRIMARDLGNVEYDEEAALYPGASYKEPDRADMYAPEILLADSGDPLYGEEGYEDKKMLEAAMAAGEIKKLMKELLVTDKETGELRNPRYSDIVILLRSLNGWADSFAGVLNAAGIPAHTMSATGYFSAVEVQTVLALLRILDNPRQDIPLTAVLRSPIVGLSDEELAQLRLTDKKESFHACVLQRCEELSEAGAAPDSALEQKLLGFYRMYKKLRGLVPDTPIHELIEILLKETGYGDYAAAMPAGGRRHANLLMLVEKAIAYENTSYKGLFHFVRYIDELQKYDVDFGEADTVGENENVVRIMSIHKSKGLEFPVVFVCGLGKNFNRQDVRSHMVLHSELGMGLDDMNAERRLKSPTIAKRAIAKQIDLENLGEELRVLYVALTRAKEKLVLTGTLKDAGAVVEKMRGASSVAQEAALSYMKREGASGCLDWVLEALLSYGDRYPVQIISAAELVSEEMSLQIADAAGKEECMAQIAGADRALTEMIARRFSFVYPNAQDIMRKNKYSVSELKHRAMREHLMKEDEELSPVFMKEEIIPYIPPFARELEGTEEEINQGAMRGTAMHRVMECYAFTGEAGAAEQVDAMLMRGRITREMKELVKLPLVEEFAASKTGKRMKAAEEAGRLYREKPFVMGFSEAELKKFGFGSEKPGDGTEDKAAEADGDLTLIQGIIDAFWIEADGIVLLDYKTDRVETEQELTDRYGAQLALYAEALERIFAGETGRPLKVKEKLMYSFRLGEVISL